jgi:putative membrane protein
VTVVSIAVRMLAAPSGVGELVAPAPGTASPLSWAAIVLVVLYLVAAVSARQRGRRVSLWRAVAFVAGCALLWAITGTGVEPMGKALFSVFMFQQLTLMIAVPSLLVLGAPAQVALHALPRSGLGGRVHRGCAEIARSRLARLALHPAIGIGLFLAAYYGLYLSPLAGVVLANPLGDLLLESCFLVVGLLFAVPVLSSGPLPRLVSHAFAGGLAWSYGEGPAVLTLLYVMERWFRAEKRAGTRTDSAAVADEEAQLAAYNARLAGLQKREPRS